MARALAVLVTRLVTDERTSETTDGIELAIEAGLFLALYRAGRLF